MRMDYSQVSPHDDKEITPFGHLRFEELSVIDGLLRGMDRTGANDDKKSIVVSGQDPSTVVASGGNGLLGSRRRNDLVTKQSGLHEGVILDGIESEVKNVGRGGDRGVRTPMTRRSWM